MFFGNTFMGSYELPILIKLLLAALAGGLVGLERETHGRPAGMRTNLLVSVGACTMTIISEAFCSLRSLILTLKRTAISP
ncbi:MAG: MgtC/SapB family protein [bacterium]|nr:MgtC/SapB family protein [bacterium]MDT8367514.1 MgtC/SapB family protein [bacterium]